MNPGTCLDVGVISMVNVEAERNNDLAEGDVWWSVLFKIVMNKAVSTSPHTVGSELL
jgi:hypothetical protein